jgi:hypothetical protein
MKTIAYSSPFVPPEWIAAHGLRPQWLRLSAAATVGRGICPYAGALVDAAMTGIDAEALVLSTACDPMRYAAALVDAYRGRRRADGSADEPGQGAPAAQHDCPVFLLNMPSTWQTAAVRNLYRGELQRLGRFLVEIGGAAPESAELARVMLAYDQARQTVCETAAGLSARQFAEALAELPSAVFDVASSRRLPDIETTAGVPLAVLGGPLLEADYDFFDLIERSGGRVALDATEGGQRTMPRRFDAERVASDPVAELADAYFDSIPDAFRRPNTKLYEWLGRELSARRVRGIIFRRYAWCDLWHAELHRLKQWTRLPVLEIDASSDDTAAANRTEGRVEAFLEMLE